MEGAGGREEGVRGRAREGGREGEGGGVQMGVRVREPFSPSSPPSFPALHSLPSSPPLHTSPVPPPRHSLSSPPPLPSPPSVPFL
jgi:hypothetical protein